MTTNKNKDKHTPGPWIVKPSSNPKNGTDWRDIVSNGDIFKPSYVGEALARDAQLISAAPEMLAALKSLYARAEKQLSCDLDCEESTANTYALLAARNAIAKAEGAE